MSLKEPQWGGGGPAPSVRCSADVGRAPYVVLLSELGQSCSSELTPLMFPVIPGPDVTHGGAGFMICAVIRSCAFVDNRRLLPALKDSRCHDPHTTDHIHTPHTHIPHNAPYTPYKHTRTHAHTHARAKTALHHTVD